MNRITKPERTLKVLAVVFLCFVECLHSQAQGKPGGQPLGQKGQPQGQRQPGEQPPQRQPLHRQPLDVDIKELEFDFDNQPGIQHEFKLEIPPSREDCLFQFIRQGAQLHMSFEVRRNQPLRDFLLCYSVTD